MSVIYSEPTSQFVAYAKEVFQMEAEAITRLIPYLDNQFELTIRQILNSKGRLIVTGMGKSGLIGKKIVATFSSVGIPSLFLHSAEAFHGDLGLLIDGDMVIALSNSGETTEVLQLIPFINANNLPLIAITGNKDSTLARNAKYHLYIGVSREACPLDLAPTSSSTAMLVMGDAMAVALMRARNFQPKDFARLHPGGNLGRKLLTTVADIMSKENLPLIQEDADMISVIDNITMGKLGLVVIHDKDNKVIGIITDGDLRRILKSKGANAFRFKAKDFMITSPVTLPSNARLVDAEKLMLQHKITSLLVVENENLLGIVQIYSIS